jgi:thiamine pyrophosphate-dependent acetolactate synthase large subunit-like protein
LLAACERPLVVAGSGAYYAGAEAALAEFASAFATPVCAPIWDRGAVPGPLDEFVGVVGAASGGPELLADADLLLLLGAAADYRVNYLQGSAGVIGYTPMRKGWASCGGSISRSRPIRGYSSRG